MNQKLFASINYRKIISDLTEINYYITNSNINNKEKEGCENISYLKMVNRLLSTENLSPNNGNQTDLAHPAIYPTRVKPRKKLENNELKLFNYKKIFC